MDQVAQIRDAVDIVSLLGEYITVTKAGKNFKALCPFHNEKSPSFIINPDRQRWHCFGCNKGGDCYAFLMEYERMEFPEALRFLADRAGITLVTHAPNTELTSKKEQMYRINGLVKEYYHYILTKLPVGNDALAYLKNRGISDKLIETFALGYAPDSGTALSTYLINKKKYKKEELIEAGLVIQGRHGAFDFFRGRLMFPLIDQRDNVVGFSGRILERNDNVGKYVNTRETLVYHKGEHFFGINVTKDALRRENEALIVEGEFDVISCFAHGISNVVGVKGTALTEQQVNLLARYVQKIQFCFDDDIAGQEAIKRSLLLGEKKGLTQTVVKIPQGKDPDEALTTDPGLFKKAVKEAIGAYDYILDKLISENDAASADGKKKIVAGFLPYLIPMQNEIVKEHYLRNLGNVVGTSYESIVKELERIKTKETKVLQQLPSLTSKEKRSREEIREEFLLALIVQSTESQKLFHAAYTILADAFVPERACQKIIVQLASFFETTEQFSAKAFAAKLPSELIDCFDRCLLKPLPEFASVEKAREEVQKKAAELRPLYLRQQLKVLSHEMRALDETAPEYAALQEKYARLTMLLNKA